MAAVRAEGEPGSVASDHEVHVLLAMLRHSTDLAGVLRPDGSVVTAPFGFLGYAPEHLAGLRSFDLVHPDDVAGAAETLLGATTSSGLPTSPFRCRLRHADGGWRTYEIVGTDMTDDPTVGGIVFNGRDVTEPQGVEEAATPLPNDGGGACCRARRRA